MPYSYSFSFCKKFYTHILCNGLHPLFSNDSLVHNFRTNKSLLSEHVVLVSPVESRSHDDTYFQLVQKSSWVKLGFAFRNVVNLAPDWFGIFLSNPKKVAKSRCSDSAALSQEC
jgi:hypothetical protein